MIILVVLGAVALIALVVAVLIPVRKPKPEFIPFDFSGLPADKQILLEMVGILMHVRLSKHITTRELASMVGVPARCITSMENGNPHTLQFLCRVADALGCDFEITERGAK